VIAAIIIFIRVFAKPVFHHFMRTNNRNPLGERSVPPLMAAVPQRHFSIDLEIARVQTPPPAYVRPPEYCDVVMVNEAWRRPPSYRITRL
jgi:hypothetical protein